jgi:surface polysaccharide O-acyltransferase-like enzyme
LETIKAERNSSVELFRILATFLVIAVHFNGWFVGGLPAKLDIGNLSTFRLGQSIIQSVCCVCVNCFIIIAGYFGLSIKFKTFLNMFMILVSVYIPCGIILFWVSHDYTSFSFIKTLLNHCLVFSKESWFIQCYLMLVFLSPLLNSFIDRCGKKLIYYSLALLFIEFWFDCLRSNVSLGFNHGYSVIHFVLLYLLSRTLRIYSDTVLKVKCQYWIVGFFISTAIIWLLYVLGIKWTFWYSNIFVVISSFCLFMPFLYKTFYNKYINSVSGSVFMVYLLHTTNPLCEWLSNLDLHLLNEYSYGFYLLYVFCIMSAIFVVSILYDKLRLLILTPLSTLIEQYIERKFDKFPKVF